MIKKGLAVGIVLLFLLSSAMSVGIGGITRSIRVSPSEKTMNSSEMNRYSIHRYPEGYSEHTPMNIPYNTTTTVQNSDIENPINQISSNGGPMDSPWPMYSHDLHHTGLSLYSTADNPLTEKWRFPLSTDCFYAGFILDSSGIIYGGSAYIYGIYQNGTMKWAYPTYDIIESTPAIDENGIIYIGTIWGMPNYLHAIYSNNGTLKWLYSVGSNSITSSPSIGSDGTIYFADWAGFLHAVYPNGTMKWKYYAGNVVTSSPAIGDDGMIYIGSHDDNVYAFYPNGTVKWRYQTGSWVHASPTIGSDGTIYIGSDDGYLYALNPEDGSMIWRCNVGYTWCSPTIGPDGTLYLGVWEMKFYAISANGTIKWTYNAPGRIWFGSSAAVSSDGTIYFGTTTQDGGSGALIALNPDGSERFRDTYGYYATSPAIGEDGTIYAPSFNYASMTGQLHTFGRGPLKADAGGPYTAYAGEPFTVSEDIYGGIPPYTCHWEFDDGGTSDERHPSHTYHEIGQYNITFTVTDSEHNTSVGTTTIDVTYGPPDATLIKPTGGVYVANIQIIPGDGLPLIFGHITLEVNASHPVADIDHVEFYIDGKLQATDRTPPYQWVWRQRYLFNSFHLITIVAVSTVGTSAERNYQVIKFF